MLRAIADTAGQGWGINEEIGGMVGYRAMLVPGHVSVAGDGAEFTVKLINALGDTVFTKTLTPEG